MEKNKINKKKRFAVYFQIVLMVGMTFAFSYILHESSRNGRMIGEAIYVQKKGYSLNFSLLFKEIGKLIFDEKSFVSALAESDLQQGIYTCPIDKNGSICQEYFSSECDSKCAVSCLPTSREQSITCKPGTCYDSLEGTCQVGATQGKCEQDGGQWFNDIFGNIPQCRAGCCILGNNAYFGTEQQCTHDSGVLGLRKDFRPEINTEISCIALSRTQEEGACVFEHDIANTCKYTTKTNCMQNLKGRFYSGLLCSNSDLHTECQSQKSIGCVEGKDEVYWLDSCGNQENIYDSNKIKSFNNGRILPQNESCSLVSGNNLLANQASCGNCNYLLGSICGKKTATQKLSEPSADFVCRDLSCIDENGNKRKHGESWCIYQGVAGVDNEKNRAVDTVGSRDFRKVCINGEVNTEPCADYRNEICAESQTDIPGGKFSSAACRINLGYTCYDNNKEGKKDQCGKNPDCFIKHVGVGTFAFDICAPKYVPGFNLADRGEGSAAICSIANQKCTVVYVKQLSGWKCKGNCECESPAFAEQMNDLCISLGDCGTKANYIGDLTINNDVLKDGGSIGNGLGNQYINGLVKYADEKLFRNKFIESADLSKLYGELGIPGWLGSASNPQDSTAGIRKVASMTAGMAGVGVMVTTFAVGYFAGGYVGLAPGGIQGTMAFGNVAMGPTLGAASGAFAGAAIGLAVVSLLLDFTGVGRGLPPALTYGLMAAGAFAGAVIGIAATSSSTGIVVATALLAVAWILIIVVIIVIIIFFALGIGKIKKITYDFKCDPWEAPTGGLKCGQCGKDGFPCSQYSCQSLGQTCQLINEETGSAECVNIAPGDAGAPIISPMRNILPDGYSIEETDSGIKIKTNTAEGCISDVYTPILFGIVLNEHGQCKMGSEHTASFNDMGQSLDAGLFLTNHSLPILIPSLEELGLENFNLNTKADNNIYIRCQDKSGNKNINEYVINYCVKPGNDTTPAAVIDRNPYLETVKIDAALINASILTNEPADCNWDTADKSYYLMSNNFTCANGFGERTRLAGLGPSGWRCDAQLPFALNKNQTTFYVRCLDQPTFTEENATRRNANTQSYELKFSRSARALNIDSINIDNKTLSFSTEQGTVEVIVKTSGGLDGTAKCGYKWGNTTNTLFDTWKREHRQSFPVLSLRDEDSLRIVCEDLIGNTAEKTAHFKIKFDTEAPRVTRAYAQSGSLFVITDEDAECFYSLNSQEQCIFEINNSTSMSGENSKTHSVQFNAGSTYYIKCRDKFGHYPGSCNIIVRNGKYETQGL